MEDKYYDYYQDDYGTHYGEYAGTYAQDVAGYSDDVITDAFDGEPDAYGTSTKFHTNANKEFANYL